ncbi:hypothetical protein BV25DRAFT_1826983 [Artomyces pyxidatus]|uniref:Uncharacterized protein n=1 Tax=Artomyces pyxidatus TaxID=48021 RepID=A0ACB8SYU5_9AGAM|nr:hypothetical protein BV25DRAFT_1826983 [Artomyces pyxidatus]
MPNKVIEGLVKQSKSVFRVSKVNADLLRRLVKWDLASSADLDTVARLISDWRADVSFPSPTPASRGGARKRARNNTHGDATPRPQLPIIQPVFSPAPPEPPRTVPSQAHAPPFPANSSTPHFASHSPGTAGTRASQHVRVASAGIVERSRTDHDFFNTPSGPPHAQVQSMYAGGVHQPVLTSQQPYTHFGTPSVYMTPMPRSYHTMPPASVQYYTPPPMPGLNYQQYFSQPSHPGFHVTVPTSSNHDLLRLHTTTPQQPPSTPLPYVHPSQQHYPYR